MKPYTTVTRGVRVTIRPFFLADQSDAEAGRYVWAYKVQIENLSPATVQLLKRSWIITDALGREMHVHGEGVVGEQPILEPGESFDYTSGTPLPTPSGFMRGTYHMIVTGTGEEFDAAVPAFSLDSPHQQGGVH